jgi:hypothetical protein
MRREDPARDALPVFRNGERTLPASRGIEHGAEDGGGNRAHPARRNEAWAVLAEGEGRTARIPGVAETMPGDAGRDTMNSSYSR